MRLSSPRRPDGPETKTPRRLSGHQEALQLLWDTATSNDSPHRPILVTHTLLQRSARFNFLFSPANAPSLVYHSDVSNKQARWCLGACTPRPLHLYVGSRPFSSAACLPLHWCATACLRYVCGFSTQTAWFASRADRG